MTFGNRDGLIEIGRGFKMARRIFWNPLEGVPMEFLEGFEGHVISLLYTKYMFYALRKEKEM